MCKYRTSAMQLPPPKTSPCKQHGDMSVTSGAPAHHVCKLLTDERMMRRYSSLTTYLLQKECG